jgi:hypothetical protein
LFSNDQFKLNFKGLFWYCSFAIPGYHETRVASKSMV